MQDEFENATRQATDQARNAGAKAKASAGAVGEEFRRTAAEVQEQFASAAETVKEQAGEAAESLKHKARAMADDQKAAGAEHIGGLARAINLAADEMEKELPQAASFVREAAAKVDNVSHMIRERSIEDLVQEANGFARANPVVFFGISLAAGFALSRFLKSSAAHGERSHAQVGEYRAPTESHPFPQPHPSSEAASAPPERLAAIPSSQF